MITVVPAEGHDLYWNNIMVAYVHMYCSMHRDQVHRVLWIDQTMPYMGIMKLVTLDCNSGVPWCLILVSQAGTAGNCRCTGGAESTWLRVWFSWWVSYFLWLWSSVIHPLYCWELAQSLSNFIILLAEDCLILVRGRDYICSFISLELTLQATSMHPFRYWDIWRWLAGF